MEIEYIGEILEGKKISMSPETKKQFRVGEKVKVRLRKDQSRKTKGLSPEAQDLIRLFEEAPDLGGYSGQEITREFIHEREDIF